MRKKKRKVNGICIFCGTEGEVTDEHIFPESWYPDDTPPNTPKWKAPSCKRCNNDYYGKRESNVFPFLAMTAEPNHPGARGIAERGFKAADESRGKDARGKAARAHTLELMRARAKLEKSRDIPEGADYLGWRHQYPNLLTTYVREEDILPVIGKIARGVLYLVTGERIDERFSVKPFRELSAIPPVFQGHAPNETKSCGPGVKAEIFFLPQLPKVCSLTQLTIWDTHVWYVLVIPTPEHTDSAIVDDRGRP